MLKKRLLYLLIIINILLSAYSLILGDIHYDVDVSRDFLVMNDIAQNKHLTLLGPRSGAIPGVFHGPLWFYVNLPAFLLGKGNPLFVGWCWFFLSVLFLFIIYFIARKLFDSTVAILSVALFSVNSIINPLIGLKNFYNPYGAVFLFPLFFFFFYTYIKNLKVKYLIISLFLCGLIVQFQMAFGIPLLLSVTLYLFCLLFRKKKFFHLLSYIILTFPLSSFIIFDFKHNFLQFNAIVQFLSEGKSQLNLLDILSIRFKDLLFGFFDFLSPGKNILTVVYGIIFFAFLEKSLLKKNASHQVYSLFTYLFVSFWVISVLYKGGVGNYFWPLLPVAIIVFSSFVRTINFKVFVISFTILYLINLYSGITAILDFKVDVNKRGPYSWSFNKKIAKQIYEDAKGEFGYFSYSPDRFAYQQRYAMIYEKNSFPNIKSFASEKKPLTYLLEVDPPQDRPELNGTSWRISDVKIDRSPDQTFRFDFIKVEKYFLNNDEIEIQPNPYLLDNVFIR